jgi:precorrin-3B synthase
LSHDPSSAPVSSACPSLRRIVAARDGGLCRIKLFGGALHAEQAFAIADAADAHTSGVIELTNRGNLQLRGVQTGQEAALSERLLQAGLGAQRFVVDGPPSRRPSLPPSLPPSLAPSLTPPNTAGSAATEQRGLASMRVAPSWQKDQRSATDDLHNVMISPLAGCDPQGTFDSRQLGAQILAHLQNEPRFSALSPKFAILLDGGERLAMIDHPHDIWLSAMPAQPGKQWFAFGLAGRPSAISGSACAAVEAAHVPSLIDALLHLYLDLAGPADTRMRHVLAARGEEAVVANLTARVGFPLRRGAEVDVWRRAPVDPALRFGAHRQTNGNRWHVGAQPPLGRVDAAKLRSLAALAEAAGDGMLRITPWQSVLLANVAEASVKEVEAGFDGLGLVREADHPLARLIACAGSDGCAKSHAATKADAMALATRLPPGIEVHLTGCIRSCAVAHCSPYTLLAVAPGRYDLYRRRSVEQPTEKQEASQRVSTATPATSDAQTDARRRFGRLLAVQLTIEEAARLLGEAARSDSHA